MRFSVQENKNIYEGKLVYIKNEYSFDFEPKQSSSYSVLIGDLNIAFDWELYARQVWGYNPYGGWIKKDLELPNVAKGKLMMIDEIDDIERIEESKDWSTYHDPVTGWICIGNYSNNDEAIAVEFATNTIAVICNQKIIALWLKPDFVKY